MKGYPNYPTYLVCSIYEGGKPAISFDELRQYVRASCSYATTKLARSFCQYAVDQIDWEFVREKLYAGNNNDGGLIKLR